MSVDRFEGIWRWVEQLRAELPLGDAISIVAARVETAGIEDHYSLAWNLDDLLREAGRYQEALELLDRIIELYPANVRPLISKASLNLYWLDDAEEALRCIDRALERAYRTESFRRESLGVKARILLQLGRGEQLTPVLEEIMSLNIVKGDLDIGRERDFVDRAPPGLIPQDVVDRYNQFRPKRAGDTGFDEPPECEPPERE
jgi:tetratricopeptide (TPR) repeat protein